MTVLMRMSTQVPNRELALVRSTYHDRVVTLRAQERAQAHARAHVKRNRRNGRARSAPAQAPAP